MQNRRSFRPHQGTAWASPIRSRRMHSKTCHRQALPRSARNLSIHISSKQIVLNGKNWSLFFEDTFVRPEEANLVGGKDVKTNWLLKVNSISSKLSKESYSVPVDEYTYVKSIYDWLMGILI